MSVVPPPLRFLAAVVGGWALLRGAMLAPDWWIETGQAAAPPPTGPAGSAAAAPTQAVSPAAPAVRSRRLLPTTTTERRSSSEVAQVDVTPPSSMPAALLAASAKPLLLNPSFPPLPPLPSLPADRAGQSRWSGSAWLLLREERGREALAPGGTLGGSQAGLRLLYRLDPQLQLSGRLYAPLRRTQGAEAAAGLDWRPLRNVPLHLLAERRQALGSEGRSAFGLTVYGGHGGRLAGRLRYDAYAQAGVVGLRSRDLFADGAARLWAPAGRFEVGGALWGAGQPGAARLDAGPQVSGRLPTGRADLRLTADWRFRLAGDAEPGSGPALTLGADF